MLRTIRVIKTELNKKEIKTSWWCFALKLNKIWTCRNKEKHLLRGWAKGGNNRKTKGIFGR